MIRIVPDEDIRAEDGFLKPFEAVAEAIAVSEGLSPFDCEVSLYFSAEDEMRELNANYRGIDQSTDVLSFPMYESPEKLHAALRSFGPGKRRKTEEDDEPDREGDNNEEEADEEGAAPFLLGDVVICKEVALKQAKEQGHSEERELVFLFAHGLFHILGYDHGEGMPFNEKEMIEKSGFEM